MDYRIEKKQAFQLVCKKKYVNKPQGDTATADISAFWNECTNDGTMQKLCKYARFDNLNGVLGVCFSKDMAVFECRGKMPDAFKKTYLQICSEFFPQSNYEYGSGVELEVYPSDNVDDPEYYCEIWIAVNEKK